MANRPVSTEQRAHHWDTVYEGRNPETVSWYQPEPVVSLEMVDALASDSTAAVVDIGGGASVLVDRLLARGFSDLTVLDVSAASLRASRQRLGDDVRVDWIRHDLLSWEPTRRYDVWHDRAVLHFLAADEVDAYRELVHRSVAPHGSIIIATFAPDGPERCSGLPVTRYTAEALGALLGSAFGVVETRREVHTTPSGAVQPFVWIAARRTPPRASNVASGL